MPNDQRTTHRIISALPFAALLLTSTLAGCGKKEEPTTTAPTSAPPAPTATTPSGPAGAPGGPGGTMMSKPSTNPAGAVGDAQITAKVKSKLIGDNRVAAKDINVDTKSQVVVLRGTQKTQAAIGAAVKDAQSIEGVKKVTNQLTVKP